MYKRPAFRSQKSQAVIDHLASCFLVSKKRLSLSLCGVFLKIEAVCGTILSAVCDGLCGRVLQPSSGSDQQRSRQHPGSLTRVTASNTHCSRVDYGVASIPPLPLPGPLLLRGLSALQLRLHSRRGHLLLSAAKLCSRRYSSNWRRRWYSYPSGTLLFFPAEPSGAARPTVRLSRRANPRLHVPARSSPAPRPASVAAATQEVRCAAAAVSVNSHAPPQHVVNKLLLFSPKQDLHSGLLARCVRDAATDTQHEVPGDAPSGPVHG